MKALLTIGLMGTALLTSLAGSEPMVARVIFAETGGISSPREIHLVASVVKNRIAHPGFGGGRLRSLYGVAYQNGAFSCIGDKRNSNWMLGAKLAKGSSDGIHANIHAWNQALMLSGGNFKPEPDIVYYHDKSIAKPKGWDNRYWKAVKRMETEHFVFYSVQPASKV